MPIFCPLSKNTLLSCPYFVKKTSTFSKTRCSHVIFSNFSWKSPCCHAHIRSKKRHICQNYTILWAKKVNRVLFFFQKRPFPKKQTALMPIFCPKNVYSLKNTVLTCNFFPNLSWKTLCCHAHIWSKNVDSVKTILYYGPNESIGSPFFPIFHEKITALISIFCQKNLFSLKKHIVLMSIFYEKNVHSLKNTVLSCHSFQIFHEKPNSVMPIFVQKNVNSVITTL